VDGESCNSELNCKWINNEEVECHKIENSCEDIKYSEAVCEAEGFVSSGERCVWMEGEIDPQQPRCRSKVYLYIFQHILYILLIFKLILFTYF
jgi:hypothetical protein